ncbi:MAG TPA: hypothetical protein VFE55_15070 [Acidimicrobiia bacterium]|nr:hypothetical protein [Acidimicrobiia bacterium]
MDCEPCDGSTLTADELETLKALELQFAVPAEPAGAPPRLGWRARLGLALWAAGGALAVATVFGATPLRFVAAALTLAGFTLLLAEV